MSRSRGWCFTLPNYTDDEIKILDALECDYMVYGREVAPTTQTPHLQGYIYFKNARQFSAMKKCLPERAHLEAAKGSPQQNDTYCSKEGAATRRGTLPVAGKRTDLAAIKAMVKEGKSLREIADASTSYQTLKFAQTMLTLQPVTALRKVNVRWYWGPTGGGKTRRAYEEAMKIDPDIWMSSRNLKWWDGYTGQKCVIIDDLRGDFCTFHEMLRILDIYPLRLEVKGGSVAAAFTDVWITSAYQPTDIWQSVEDKGQLLRRLSTIMMITRETAHIQQTDEIAPDTPVDTLDTEVDTPGKSEYNHPDLIKY